MKWYDRLWQRHPKLRPLIEWLYFKTRRRTMLEKTKEVLKDHSSEYGVSDKVWKEIKDVESGVKLLLELKAEYESNKHYIELGKAIKEAFESGYSLDAYEFDECDDIKIVDSISRVDDLLEWAEGRK